MRSILLFLSLAIGVSAFAQDKPIDPAKRASIEELLALMKIDQMQKQMLPQFQEMMVDSVEKAIPPEMQLAQNRASVAADIKDFEGRLFVLMTDRMDFAKMKPEYVKLYDETFTADEVAGIVAFYKTPAGQAYLAKLPVLTSKTMVFTQRVVAALMPDIQTMSAAWVEEMKRKYGVAGAQ